VFGYLLTEGNCELAKRVINQQEDKADLGRM